MHKVLIVDIGSPLETQAIRAVAEAFGYCVEVAWIGSGNQLYERLTQPMPSLIVLNGHGDETGLCLPELAVDLQGEQLFYPHLTPVTLVTLLIDLTDKIVINLSCLGGSPAWVNGVKRLQVRYYIASNDYIDGDVTLVYMTNFLYGLTRQGTVQDIHQKTIELLGNESTFNIFS